MPIFQVTSAPNPTPEEHLGVEWDEEVGEYRDKTPDDIEWPVYDEAKGG